MADACDLAFPLLGRALRAEAVPDAVARWLRAHWCFPDLDAEAHPFTLTIAPDETGGEELEAAWREADVQEVPLEWRGAAGRCQIRGEAAAVRVALLPGGARIGFRRPEGQPSHAFYAALFVAIGEGLRASGLIPLHAAAAAQGGEATAFLGPSGTGKSTTLLRAVRAGWRPMAEDRAWLDPASLMLYGLDRGVHLLPEGRVEFFPELDPDRCTRRSDGKLFLSYEALDQPVRRAARLTRLAMLSRDAAHPPGWAPLSARDGVRMLWEASGLPLLPEARLDMARRLPGILLRTRLYRFTPGRGEMVL